MSDLPSAEIAPSHAFASLRCRLLSCHLLDSLGGKLAPRFPDTEPALLGALMMSFLSAIAMIGLTMLQGENPVTIIFPTILAALTVGAGLYVVVWLFELTRNELSHSFDSHLTSHPARAKVYSWFLSIADWRSQLRFTAICIVGGLALASLLASMPEPPFPIYWSTHLALGLAGFSLGQGAYLAIATPIGTTLILKLSTDELNIYRPNPSASSCLVGISRIMNSYAVVCAVMVTLCLLTLASLRPEWSDSPARLLLATLIAGYSITTYVFVLPQIALSIRVRRERDLSLRDLHKEAKELWPRVIEGDSEAKRLLADHMALVTAVGTTRGTLMDFAAVRSYLGSLAAQAAAFGATQVNWSSVLHWLAERSASS